LKKENSKTNALIHETSPYLLQHAHNPVDWHPWNAATLKKAKSENKPLIISIGYSACHWCHVMEHESFEDELVADLMNTKFFCIKVDREERPDVDHLYMNAIQLITGHGGWPLNMFALPDGKPFHGGTYFRKTDWIRVLETVSRAFGTNFSELEGFSNRLKEGIVSSGVIKTSSNNNAFSKAVLDEMVVKWSQRFDLQNGGLEGAPKFPMPQSLLFLLAYAVGNDNKEILEYVGTSLDRMAFGGIYDQIGGGFARYSTDAIWKVPHFEKMLYDNAQLLSLYSEAFKQSRNPLYKQIIEQSYTFLMREMIDKSGAFYSALDADSEGVEGKYYVWTESELKNVLGDDFDLAAIVYNVNKGGYWEHDRYILLRNRPDETLSNNLGLSVADLSGAINRINLNLLKQREKRVRPGLDDKTLTSWNALMLSGLIDAYPAFGSKAILTTAFRNANFIAGCQMQKDGSLFHNYKNGKSNIPGFLEDYAFTAKAFLDLYQITLDIQWLEKSKTLCEYALTHFYDEESGFFYFSSKNENELVVRTIEVYDSVTPSSNSVMAFCLFRLGLVYENVEYINKSEKMVLAMSDQMQAYGSGHSNWAGLYSDFLKGVFEVAIVGPEAIVFSFELSKHYLPHTVIAGSTRPSKLPILKNRFVEGKTLIYICRNKTCQKPVETIEEAMGLMGYPQ
jgi:uncharacterized protein YyaL (SSP411 family)